MVDAITENRISPETEIKDINTVDKILLRGQLHTILNRYQTDIHLNPLDDNLLVQRAKLYIQLARSKVDKYEQNLILQLALHDYGKAIGLTQTKADYYAERAEIYHYLKHFEQAVADYLQANLLNPGNIRFKEKLRKLQLLKRQATVIKFLKRVKHGVDIMAGGILSALAGAMIWGMGEIIYGVPFMVIALVSFTYGLVQVLKSEIRLYELQKQ